MLENDVYHADYHNLTGTVQMCIPWKHLVGVYRDALMEYWQSKGVDNVDFETIRELQEQSAVEVYPDLPPSLRYTYYILQSELPKNWYAAAVKDICMQYNAGRRS